MTSPNPTTYPTELILAAPDGAREMRDGSKAPRPGTETDHLYTETFFVAMAQESGGHLQAVRYLRAVIESAWCGNGSSEVEHSGLLPITDAGHCPPVLANNDPFVGLPEDTSKPPQNDVAFVDLTFTDLTEREDVKDPMLYSWALEYLLTDAGLTLLALAERAGERKRFKVPAEIGGGAPRRERFRRDGDKSTRDMVRRTYFTDAAAARADEIWSLAKWDPERGRDERQAAMNLPGWLADELAQTILDQGVWPNWGICFSAADWPALVEAHPDELTVDHDGLIVNGAPSWKGIALAFNDLRAADPTASMECRLWIAPDGRWMIEPWGLTAGNPAAVDRLTESSVGMRLRHFGGGPPGPASTRSSAGDLYWKLSPYCRPGGKHMTNHFH